MAIEAKSIRRPESASIFDLATTLQCWCGQVIGVKAYSGDALAQADHQSIVRFLAIVLGEDCLHGHVTTGLRSIVALHLRESSVDRSLEKVSVRTAPSATSHFSKIRGPGKPQACCPVVPTASLSSLTTVVICRLVFSRRVTIEVPTVSLVDIANVWSEVAEVRRDNGVLVSPTPDHSSYIRPETPRRRGRSPLYHAHLVLVWKLYGLWSWQSWRAVP